MARHTASLNQEVSVGALSFVAVRGRGDDTIYVVAYLLLSLDKWHLLPSRAEVAC